MNRGRISSLPSPAQPTNSIPEQMGFHSPGEVQRVSLGLPLFHQAPHRPGPGLGASRQAIVGTLDAQHQRVMGIGKGGAIPNQREGVAAEGQKKVSSEIAELPDSVTWRAGVWHRGHRLLRGRDLLAWCKSGLGVFWIYSVGVMAAYCLKSKAAESCCAVGADGQSRSRSCHLVSLQSTL